MFLQLLCTNGQPAYVDPDEIAALIGYYDTRNGGARLATRVLLKNRDNVFAQGEVDKVYDEVARFKATRFEGDGDGPRCPKCNAESGDDWSQCGDWCPMGAPGKPLIPPVKNGSMPTECRVRADGSPLICKDGPCEHDPKPQASTTPTEAYMPVQGI